MRKVVVGEFGARRGRRASSQKVQDFSMTPEMGEHGYQASEYFVPSKDSQGHTIKITTMVTPEMKREIQVILSRRVIPLWETEGDLIRWCLYQGLKLIEKRVKDPQITSAHAVVASWTDFGREQEEVRYWENHFLDVRKHLARLVKGGDFIPARKLLRHLETQVARIADDYWRQKFQKEIVDYYASVKAKARVQEKKLRLRE